MQQEASKEAFGERLRNVLFKQKIKRKELAEKVGVSPAAVGHWVKGGDIEYAKLRLLATILNCNWVWLRYGEEAARSACEAGTSSVAAVLRVQELTDRLANETLLREALDMANIDVWIVNVTTGHVEFSKTCHRILGRDVHSVEEYLAAVHPDDRGYIERCSEELFTSNVGDNLPCRVEYRIVRPDGEIRWLSVYRSPKYSVVGVLERISGVTIDITSAKNPG